MAVVRTALQEQLLSPGSTAAAELRGLLGAGTDGADAGEGGGVEALAAAVHEDVQRYFTDEEAYEGQVAVKAVGDVLRQMLQ